jgi:hypothetical protein
LAATAFRRPAGRQETESVIDDVDLNWKKSAVYMEAGSAMFGNCPPAG